MLAADAQIRPPAHALVQPGALVSERTRGTSAEEIIAGGNEELEQRPPDSGCAVGDAA
jgi:hypothetical protein